MGESSLNILVFAATPLPPGGEGGAGDGTGAGAWTLIASPPHLASRRRLPHVQSLSFCVLTFYLYFTPCRAALNVP